MPWQYMKDGEIQGPLSDLEFGELRGGIDPETKIYKDGWKEWRRLGEVPASEFPEPPPLPPLDESQVKPASFGRRAGALIVDYALMRWLVGLCGLGDGLFQGSSYGGPGSWGSYSSWSYASSSTGSWFVDKLGWHFAFTLAYETLLTSYFGWTLGKFAFGLVVKHGGRNLALPRSLARVVAKKLNWLTLLIGYAMALFDKDHKALHDHLCKTRVFLR